MVNRVAEHASESPVARLACRRLRRVTAFGGLGRRRHRLRLHRHAGRTEARPPALLRRSRPALRHLLLEFASRRWPGAGRDAQVDRPRSAHSRLVRRELVNQTRVLAGEKVWADHLARRGRARARNDQQVASARGGDVGHAAALGVEVLAARSASGRCPAGSSQASPWRSHDPAAAVALHLPGRRCRGARPTAPLPSQSTTTGNSRPLAWCTVSTWTASAPTGCGGSSWTGVGHPLAEAGGGRVVVEPLGGGRLLEHEAQLAQRGPAAARRSGRGRRRGRRPSGRAGRGAVTPGGALEAAAAQLADAARALRARGARPRPAARRSARAARSRSRSAEIDARRTAAGAGPPRPRRRRGRRGRGARGGTAGGAGRDRKSVPPREAYGMPAASSHGKRSASRHVVTARTAMSP